MASVDITPQKEIYEKLQNEIETLVKMCQQLEEEKGRVTMRYMQLENERAENGDKLMKLEKELTKEIERYKEVEKELLKTKEKCRKLEEEVSEDRERCRKLEFEKAREIERYNKLEADIAMENGKREAAKKRAKFRDNTILDNDEIKIEENEKKELMEMLKKLTKKLEANSDVSRQMNDPTTQVPKPENEAEESIDILTSKLDKLVNLSDSLEKRLIVMGSEISRIDLEDVSPEGEEADFNFNAQKKMLHSTSCNQCGRSGDCYILNETHLHFVSERIGDGWKKIVRSGGMKEYVVEQVDRDYRGVAEKAYQGLIRYLHQSPYPVSHCWLLETLASMQRHDILQDLNENFTDMKWTEEKQHKEMYIGSAETIFGREEEIKKFREFCEDNQTAKKILVLQGLPGIGRKEVTMQALSNIDQNNVVYPNFFMRERSENQWTIDQILDVIAKYWKANINDHLRGEIDIRELLSSVQRPLLLVLEISSLRMENCVKYAFWNFIRTLSRSNTQLKVIVTSSEYPHQLVLWNNFEIIKFNGLNLSYSQQLLQNYNPELTAADCNTIFKCCGGNPLLLRKISFKIKSLCGESGEVGVFVKELRNKTLNLEWFHQVLRQTYWSQKMNNILEMMDDDSLVVLAKLVVFINRIPKESLYFIYGDNNLLHEADHLYTNHSIIEKTLSVPNNYRISTIYRAFIEIFIKNDKKLYSSGGRQHTLGEIKKQSLELVRGFFLHLLQELGRMYNSRCFKARFNDCESLINENGGTCSCGNQGLCNSYIVSMDIFRLYEFMFFKFIKEPAYSRYRKAFLSQPIEIIQLLRSVIPRTELREFKQSQFMLTDRDNVREIDRVVAIATYVLLKEQTRNKVAEDINMLARCISVLENGDNLTAAHRALLLLCYLNRAQTYAVVMGNKNDAYHDLAKANEICEMDHIDGARIIEYHNICAEIAFHTQQYERSIQCRKLQKIAAETSLGVHPLTATAYYLLAKSQEQISDYSEEASKNYHIAKRMFAMIKDGLRSRQFHVYLIERFVTMASEKLKVDKSWFD